MGNIVILAGGFGSGKSEIALNLALEKAKNCGKVILADLDIVNPFLASRELRKELEEEGVRLVAPVGELAFGDVPNIPAEMMGLVSQDNEMYIDLTGDEVGALVIGYLSRHIKRAEYEMYLVINPYRPFAVDLESILELKNTIEGTGKIKFTGIISNPNLVEETTLDLIINGHRRVVGYAESLDLSVKYLTVEKRFYDQLLCQYGNILKKIELFLRPEWLQGS